MADTAEARYICVTTGLRSLGKKCTVKYFLAVRGGDVNATVVPVRIRLWLFGYGQLGMIGISRRKKAA